MHFPHILVTLEGTMDELSIQSLLNFINKPLSIQLSIVQISWLPLESVQFFLHVLYNLSVTFRPTANIGYKECHLLACALLTQLLGQCTVRRVAVDLHHSVWHGQVVQNLSADWWRSCLHSSEERATHDLFSIHTPWKH